MKKIFTLIIAFMAFVLPMTAQESDDKSKSVPITLTHADDHEPNPTILRSPVHICVEAWYEATTSTLSIIYYGEAEGEVNLYRDGELVDTSSTVNTTFMVSAPGFYSIEILTDSWTATGSFCI